MSLNSFGDFDSTKFKFEIVYMKSMFTGITYTPEALYYLQNYIFIILAGMICSIPAWRKIKEKIDQKNSVLLETITSLGYLAILLLSTASLVTDSFNPFLYFRF